MVENTHKVISCYTLVDITKTGTIGTFKKGIDIDEKSWNFSRNQQRNWETVLQLISLRAQPIYLEDPVLLKERDLKDFKFSQKFVGNHNVWVFRFSSEHQSVFGDDLSLLRSDVHNVPINVGLKETTVFALPVFDCLSHHNVYFDYSGTGK